MNNKYMMMANQLMSAGYKPNGIGMQPADPTAMTFNMQSLAKPMPQFDRYNKPSIIPMGRRHELNNGFRR